MSRLKVWLLLSAGSLAYCIFAGGNIDTFAAATWFGGLGLFVHWAGNGGKT